jgi:hypothetical protein
MCGLLLFMLLSRSEPNISEADLDWLEQSGGLEFTMDANGFFKDQNVKAIFDTMLKHFVVVIKKKAAKQKDVETVFTSSILNFKCTEATFNLIRRFVSDTLNRALGLSDPVTQ